MAVTFIIKDSKPKGRTRTNIDREITDAWGTTAFRSEEDRDKCAFVERKVKKQYGGDENHVPAAVINTVK